MLPIKDKIKHHKKEINKAKQPFLVWFIFGFFSALKQVTVNYARVRKVELNR
jgi:hypothetical protein